MEFKNFDEFNNNAIKLLLYYKDLLAEKNETEQVIFLREAINKDMLRSFIKIATLTNEIQTLLNSNNKNLKLSLDNYLKNKIMHPEVTNADYIKIPKIVNKPSKTHKSKNGYDVILFKEDEKYYKLVIKTTVNKNENFVKSLHLLNYSRYIKY